MKKRRVGISVLAVLVLFGCSTTDESQYIRSEAITLTAKVEGSAVNRVVTIGANYTTSLDVAFARLDQNPFTGIYPQTYADINTALIATRDGGTNASAVHFDEPQYYQTSTSNNDTRLVGWYPALMPQAGVLTFDISDGATDVLLTQELVGNGNDKIGTETDPFFFRHQLCQVVVKVVATSQETVARWGTVASVVVKDMPTTYVVTLPGGTQAVGSADLLLNLRGSTKKMVPVSLSSDSFVECGYLLTAPRGTKLTLELTGGNGEKRIVDAPLPAGESFNSGYIYELKINLDEWQGATAGFGCATQWENDVKLDVEF